MRFFPGVARTAGAALTLLLLCLAGARGGENFDPRVREFFRRAHAGEKPTEADRRLAARMLRDWELSERTAPLDEPPHIRYLLRNIVDGEPVRSPQLRSVAWDITQKYLTREGLSRRMKYGPYGVRRRLVGGDPAAGFEPPDSAQDWFLFAACLLVMIGGIVIWILGRRRRRPDYRIYYS